MRLIVGICGASGAIVAVEMLKVLRRVGCETHLIVTRDARQTMRLETDLVYDDLCQLADVTYEIDDLAAPVASGSFRTDGMVIIPCSMKTTAGIVSGYSNNLLLRAADVCLKEGRKIVLAPREAPLSRVHLKNLHQAAKLGCVVIPLVMTFYNRPRSIEDMTDYLIGKIMAQFGLDYDRYPAWQGGKTIPSDS